MVWDGDYPWDVRVEKICKTLIIAGHEVHLVCRNSKALVRTETIDGIHIHRVFCFTGKLSRLNGFITFPAFFSPIWRSQIRRSIQMLKPDAVIIRDLPIALAVLPFSTREGIPTVLDMAECYPEMVRCAWKFDRFQFSNILVRNPYLADLVEKITLKQIDAVWVMIEESGERLQKKGLLPNKIRIVSNTPAIDFSERPKKINDNPSRKLRIVYVGLVNPSRGLATVVAAAKILKSKNIEFEIKIVGSGKDYNRISQLVKNENLEDVVKMTGWIDHKSLNAIFDDADVGLVPHYWCSHWNNTIPNKVFDYMKARIPVIVSDVKPIKRIVEQTQSGLFYHSSDANDLADKISSLTDQDLRIKLGNNGFKAIEEKYHWGNDSAVMLDSLNTLVKNAKALKSAV